MMKEIKSPQNKKIKQWNQLSKKSMRKKLGAYLLESWHLVGTAIATHQPILTILATPDQFKLHQKELKLYDNVILINTEVAHKLASTQHPQGIFAIVKLPTKQVVDPEQVTSGSWLLLDQVQDPGNIGTMVRTADAAGMTGVVFGHGTANLYNPKVTRAMQGSQFHLKLVNGDLAEWIQALKAHQIPVYGSELNPQAVSYTAVPQTQEFGLIMGNEGNGMQKQLLHLTTKNLYIPIQGQAESLNVAIAAGVLMFRLKAKQN